MIHSENRIKEQKSIREFDYNWIFNTVPHGHYISKNVYLKNADQQASLPIIIDSLRNPDLQALFCCLSSTMAIKKVNCDNN